MLKGEYVLIINSKATIRDKIRTLEIALKQFNHDAIYTKPVLRELLDRIPEQRQFNVSGKYGTKVNDHFLKFPQKMID